jgi:hypothetical protein
MAKLEAPDLVGHRCEQRDGVDDLFDQDHHLGPGSQNKNHVGLRKASEGCHRYHVRLSIRSSAPFLACRDDSSILTNSFRLIARQSWVRLARAGLYTTAVSSSRTYLVRLEASG